MSTTAFANGSISAIRRGRPSLRTRMMGLPVLASAFTRLRWFSESQRSVRLPGVSVYEFSPMAAMMMSALAAAATAFSISGAFSS